MVSFVNRDWRLLWAANGISSLGDGALLAALPLLAATLTRDPRLIAGVTAWGTLPWLLAALPAGALADRTDGRRLMSGAQLLQGVLVAVLAVLSMVHAGRIAGEIAVVYAVAFAIGVAETAVKGAGQTLVPAIVPPEQLERANGRFGATQFAAEEFLGPPLGSLLFAVATPLPFWVDAATFAVSAMLVLRMRARRRPHRAPLGHLPHLPHLPHRSVKVAEGLRWLARHPLLRVLSGLAAVANLANTMALSTLVLFATQRLHIGPGGYGLLLGAMAAGGVLGSLVSRVVIERLGGRAVVTTTVMLTPAAQLAIAFAGRDPVTVAVLAVVCSACASLWNVATMSLRQRLVPAELRGRVGNAGLALAWGAQPVGAVLGGLVAGSFGLAAPWLLAGLLRLVTALAAMPALRRWPSAAAQRTEAAGATPSRFDAGPV
jgi:MFS family permease